MAVINCKECGKEVSNKAETCPNCGVKIKRESMGCGTVILLIFLVMIFFGAFKSATDEPIKTPGKTIEKSESYQADPESERILDEIKGKRWKYSSFEDSMTGNNVWMAAVRSTNTLEFDFPYGNPQRATLTLRTHPRFGKDVYLSIERGQFLCSSYDGCKVLVRFGDGTAVSYMASEPKDNSSTTLFIGNYHVFVENMMKVDTVRISADVYEEGAPIFEFSVKDFIVESYLPNEKTPTTSISSKPEESVKESPLQTKAEIKQKILKHWVKTRSASEPKAMEIKVLFISNGDVGKVELIQGSGDKTLDLSLIAAVYAAAPFMLPTNDTKSLNIEFGPE